MRTARLVGLSPDGTSVILALEGGEELALAADDRLRAALRGDRPRLGQLEIEMESALSPREIQTRIRSGESLEDVTRVAGIPMDRVERFAAPVLAEREHVASLAMTSSVRRRGETHAHRNLRLVLTERLLSRGVDIDSIAWDAFRMEDGRWQVTAGYRSGGRERQAVFFFDLGGRFSVAGNDDARWVLGEHSASHGPQPGRRPASAAEGADTEPTLDLSDELALVRVVQEPAPLSAAPPEPEPAPEPEPEPASPLDTLDAISETQPDEPAYAGLSDAIAVPEPAVAPGAPGWEPAIVVNYPVEPSQITDEEDDGHPGTDEPGPPDPVVALADREDEAHAYEEEAEHPPPAKRVRKKRASVPSWDEIMFGGPKGSG